MLFIKGIKPTAELFGIVEVHLLIDDFDGPVNDWRLEIDGVMEMSADDGIDFLSSSFFQNDIECVSDACKISMLSPATPTSSAIFTWDTKKYENGIRTIIAYGHGEQSIPLSINVNNSRESYTALSKELVNSEIIKIVPPEVHIKVTKDIANFIEHLPGHTGLIDLELFSNERFTVPFNGLTSIRGTIELKSVLDLENSDKKNFGDTVQIKLSEKAAKFFMRDFSNNMPIIEIGLLDSNNTLRHEIRVLESDEFPATNTDVFEGE